MTDRAVVDETRRMVAATQHLRHILADRQSRFESVVTELEAGVPVEKLMVHGQAPDNREGLDRALEEFTAQRYRWRVALMEQTLADGVTISRFAELYGFSRQYAQKLAREIRARAPDD